ncbi:MAG: LysE family translocator [Paracoccaceae bacterium]|jgi:threonine/homoserine/homoserine lactone efflux protein|nr:LysE family translocator [Paracoccaceae bacterium]MDP7184839.1 LysE family translocator [Paracoccaceae bacterium]
MDIIAPYIAYAAALAVAAVIPGPGVAALVGQSLGGSVRASMFFLFGLSLGDVTYLTVAVVGLAAIAQAWAGALMLIKALGGAYLLYLAYLFWTKDVTVSQVRSRRDRSNWAAFLAGYVITIGNPKTVIFYLALAPSVLDMGAVTAAGWFYLALITIAVLFAVLTPYVMLSVRARAMMTHPASLKRLNRFAAGFIGGAGTLILGEVLMGAVKRG